jgi:hypothetical protein
MRFASIFYSVLLIYESALAASDVESLASGRSVPATPQAGSDVIVAQECGYFAILGCFRTRREAENWNDRIDSGYVINTSSAEYPSFRSGYYCVVNGPTSRNTAQQIMRSWRKVIPDAYVKNSC